MEGKTFTFTEVADALARVNAIPDAGRRTFRSRLQNFQRVGLAEVSPGKGQKIAYKLDDVLSWAFALGLTQFGFEPSIILTLLGSSKSFKKLWLRVYMEPYYFFHPVLIQPYVSKDARGTGNLPTVIFGFTGKSLDDFVNKKMQISFEEFKTRYGVIDLLSLYNRVVRELGLGADVSGSRGPAEEPRDVDDVTHIQKRRRASP